VRFVWPQVRSAVLFGATCYLIGVLSAGTPSLAERPVSTVTEQSVRQLTRALEAATAKPVAPAVEAMTTASSIIDDIAEGRVEVVPTPPPSPVQSIATTTTTTTAPRTTTTTAPEPAGVLEWPEPPSGTVKP